MMEGNACRFSRQLIPVLLGALALGLGATVKAERGGAGVDAVGGVGTGAGVYLGELATVDVRAQGEAQAGARSMCRGALSCPGRPWARTLGATRTPSAGKGPPAAWTGRKPV